MIIKILDSFKGCVLGAVDWANVYLQNKPFGPFERFTRPIQKIDEHTLKEKADIFWRDIQYNWLHGVNKEFYWSMSPNDLGDAAIWQGLYTLACAAKGDDAALLRAIKGHVLLQTLGGDNRLARGADVIGGEYKVDPSRKYYEDQGYVYVQEVSESTLLGQMLGFWSVLFFSGDDLLKKTVGRHLVNLADQVIADGYALKDQDGKIAKFGNLKPSLATAPIRLASLACLMLLAWRAGRNERHLWEYENLTSTYMGSITHPETHFLWVHPQYQDLLAYFVLVMMITMEDDGARKKKYVKSLEMQWRKNKEEGNSFYTYFAKLAGISIEDKHLHNAEMILDEFNTDPKLGPTGKSSGPFKGTGGIATKEWGWKWLRGGKTVAVQPIPIPLREPSDIFWQRSPYGTGGYADHDHNGLDYCVAYYLGKHIGVL